MRMRTWTTGKANGRINCLHCGNSFEGATLYDGEYEVPEGCRCPECDAPEDELELDGFVHHEREDFGADL